MIACAGDLALIFSFYDYKKKILIDASCYAAPPIHYLNVRVVVRVAKYELEVENTMK